MTRVFLQWSERKPASGGNWWLAVYHRAAFTIRLALQQEWPDKPFPKMATWWRNLLCNLPYGGLTTDKEKDVILQFGNNLFSLTCSLSSLPHVIPPFSRSSGAPPAKQEATPFPTCLCSIDLEMNQSSVTGTAPDIKHHQYESNSSSLEKLDT